MSGALCVMAGASGLPTVVFTPSTARGTGTGETISTNIVTASVSAGSGYIFVWSYLGGDPTVTPSFPLEGDQQRWSASLGPGQDKSATWLCEAYLGAEKAAEGTITPFVQRL